MCKSAAALNEQGIIYICYKSYNVRILRQQLSQAWGEEVFPKIQDMSCLLKTIYHRIA